MTEQALCVLLTASFLGYAAETPSGGYPPPPFDPQQGYAQILIPPHDLRMLDIRKHVD